MKIRMKLLRLTLIGFRKNYSVKFKDGLNYISGHTATGKTSILEMINYALGAKEHKPYIEISNSCSAVELELTIGVEQFLFRRKLFEFNQPVVVEIWNETQKKYTFYTRCEIDVPSNHQSLSAFLVEKLNLAIAISGGDKFSFRDLFKYSYLKQTEIDSENIMQEKDGVHNRKRKATFEVIFNLFDTQLNDYRDALKNKVIECDELEIQLQGIKDFLVNAELTDMIEYTKQAKSLAIELDVLRNDLAQIKRNKGVNTTFANSLRQRIINLKEKLKELAGIKADQQNYLNKLRLLSNQYESEIEKRQMAKDGYFAFSKFEFVCCPSCLRPIHVSRDIHDVCCLCANDKDESSGELLIIEKEIKQIKRKQSELLRFIEKENRRLDGHIKSERQCQKELGEAEKELQHLYADYDNPQLEQIELLNYEIGQKKQLQYELEQKLKMIEELEGIERYLKDKNEALERLRATIKELSQTTIDKRTIVKVLSNRFTDILKSFEYPKLSDSYVDDKNYLPYVRGNKYDKIGSLAGVTLTTTAYYLSILLEGIKNDYHHINLLLIDSPRKNLGAKPITEADVEFKDEKIFHAIIKYLIDIGSEYADKLQLIVVNNGYPDFLPPDCIVAEFDTERDDLPNGFIDDAI
jgi:DNA repair exonuclease SbcCD ATPase subunit